MNEELVELFVEKYILPGNVISVGSDPIGLKFLKKIALRVEGHALDVSVIPTSMEFAALLKQMKVPMASIDDSEVDVAVEFASQVDFQYNYIKRESNSLVRDKMIAQSASTLIVVVEPENFVKQLSAAVPCEIAIFGWKRTLTQLEQLGKASLRMEKEKPFKTETGLYIADVQFDQLFTLEDVDYQARLIPGVLETGLFIGLADKIVLAGNTIEVKSREVQ